MRRIKIEFAYDGRNFYGYQTLKNKRTVQETLENALSELLGEKIKVVASGRTDAGVSALCQVAHFDTNSTIIATNICFAVNKLLPDDIQVLSSKNASSNFHARFMAKSKTYKYFIYESEHKNPALEYSMMWCNKKIDTDLMKKGAKYLVGKHNFSAFSGSGSDAKTFTREIIDIDIEKMDNVVIISVTGNSFLYNMVRIIVRVLLDVGTGKIAPEKVKEILDSKLRQNAGALTPSKALLLYKVNY